MSDIQLTPAQARAVSASGRSVLVSAAAGAGKTRVLVERLLQRITDPDHPADADQFLLITYTNAAAAEMRARILKAVGQRLSEDPGNAHLQRQTACVHAARIGTLHAYCMELYREFGAAAGIPPGLRVGGEVEMKLLRAQVCDLCLEEFFDDYENSDRPDEGVEALLRLGLSMRGDRKLCELLESVWEKMSAFPDREDWRSRCLDTAEPEVWEQGLLQYAREDFSAPDLEPELSVRKILAALDTGWDTARKAVTECAGLKGLDAPMKDTLKAWKTILAADRDSSERAARDSLPALRTLLGLAERFDALYETEKRNRRLMDYRDMEIFALKILRDEKGNRSPAAVLAGGRFREIMVDEYQDINLMQDEIVTLLSRNGQNTFYVGDVRQSIYRFQNAEPDIFLKRYREYITDAAEGPVKILLTENFRSRKGVLDAVNHVFSRLMTTRSGEVGYDEDLQWGRPEQAGGGAPAVELLFADPDKAAERENTEDPDKRMENPRVVARRLRAIVDAGEFQPGECAILLRSPKNKAGLYRRALLEQGLDSDAAETGWMETPEILTMTALLNVLDNPLQDIYILALLRSPVFRLTNGELALLAAGQAAGWYTRLKNASSILGGRHPALLAKCETICRDLGRWRFLASESPPRRLIERIAAETELPRLCGGGAADRLDTLAALADTSGAPELSGFLPWLARAQEENTPPSVPPRNGAVRILSIHKSKGLEFPLVVLAELDTRFRILEPGAKVLVHGKLGLGARVNDGAAEYPAPPYHLAARALTRQGKAEELRLLYVAMTRAEQRLILSVPDEERWRGERPAVRDADRLVQRGRSFIDWLSLARDPDWPETRDGAGRPCQGAGLLRRDAPPPETAPVPYAHQKSVSLPSKLTATEMKGRILDLEVREDAAQVPDGPAFAAPEFILPDFGEKRGLTPAERGAATHLALQLLDFRESGTESAIRTQLAQFAAMERMTAQQAADADAAGIAALLETPLGRRLINAEALYREQKFSLLADSRLLLGDAGEEGEETLLQGVIDCLFRDEEGWTVLDFKTDRLTKAEAPARAERYRSQMSVYAYAARRMLGVEAVNMTVYFTAARTAVTLP